ncbi:hypothetical protein J6590_027323 [Homalodisca vitripennis]|nr:hypothetical protein J6590_027323 [Homalodisca vitripennis]
MDVQERHITNRKCRDVGAEGEWRSLSLDIRECYFLATLTGDFGTELAFPSYMTEMYPILLLMGSRQEATPSSILTLPEYMNMIEQLDQRIRGSLAGQFVKDN